MFNLGFGEIVILGVLALIFIGPKQLPEVARTVGRLLNEWKRATSDFQQTFTSGLTDELHHRRVEAQQESASTEAIASPEATVQPEPLVHHPEPYPHSEVAPHPEMMGHPDLAPHPDLAIHPDPLAHSEPGAEPDPMVRSTPEDEEKKNDG
ncbi:MAG: twin-arginine translocase TatA/TatE family subunit [Bdellovibrionales bacterium]